MGSAPSKPPKRSRSGLSFVSTSSVTSLTSAASDDDDVNEHESATDFKFVDVECKSFTVKWSPPPRLHVESYQVRIFPPDKIKSRTLLRALPEPEYTFKRLHSGTAYTVGVVAIERNGNRAPCSSAQVCTLPRPPRDLTFPTDATSSALEVKWRHSKGKRHSYIVNIRPEEGVTSPTHVTGITATSHVFSGLVPGTEYTVSVRSVANNVESEAIEQSITTAPRHVCDVTFTDVTQHEMTLKWKVPEGNVESYKLELCDTADTTKPPVELKKLTLTSHTFNGLVPGRAYDCKITSVSRETASKPGVFSQCTIPSQVHDIMAREIGPEEATVTWSPAFGDVDDYDLFLTPREGVSCETSPTAVKEPRYKFKGLVPGTTYKIGIVTNSKDKSSKRAVSTFITEPGMSGKLEFVKSGRSDQQKVKWQPSIGSVDSYVVYIRREDKKEPGWKMEDLYNTECLLENLTPGTKYRMEVMSMRDGRESSSLNDVFVTEPLPVESVQFNPDGCAWDKIACKWNKPEGGVDGFHLTVVTEGRTVTERYVAAGSTECTITGLQPSTLYDCAVAVESNDIESIPVWGKYKTGPGAVSGLELNQGEKRQLVAKWTAPEGGVDDYILTMDSLEPGDRSAPLTTEEGATEHTFNDLEPGSHYRVSVTPRSRHIAGPTSTAEAYTKPGNILNVHIPVDDVTKDSILVTWWGVEGNCKSVDVTLTRLHKRGEDEDLAVPATVVTQDRIEECKQGLNEYRFEGLEEGTVYGIRMCASGKTGTGDDVVLTQATISTASIKVEETLPPPSPVEETPVPEEPPKEESPPPPVIEEPKVDDVESPEEGATKEQEEPTEEKVEESLGGEKEEDEPKKTEETQEEAEFNETHSDEHESKEAEDVQPEQKNEVEEVKVEEKAESEAIEETPETQPPTEPEEALKEEENEIKEPEPEVVPKEKEEISEPEPKPPTPVAENQQSTPEEKEVKPQEEEKAEEASPNEEHPKTPSPAPEEQPPESESKPEEDKEKEEDPASSGTPESVEVAVIKPVVVIDSADRSPSPRDVAAESSSDRNGPTVTFADLQKDRKASPSPQPNGKSSMSLLAELTSN